MKKPTRHGRLADGMTTFSIVIPRELKDALKKMADESERNLGDFLRRECRRIARDGKHAAKVSIVTPSDLRPHSTHDGSPIDGGDQNKKQG